MNLPVPEMPMGVRLENDAGLVIPCEVRYRETDEEGMRIWWVIPDRDFSFGEVDRIRADDLPPRTALQFDPSMWLIPGNPQMPGTFHTGRPMHYDRNGIGISTGRYCALMEQGRGGGGRREDMYLHVAQDQIGDYRVSTVWLGNDHNFLGQGPPIIFETQIFGPKDQFVEVVEDDEDDENGGLAGSIWRWTTEDTARDGHEMVCTLVRAVLAKQADNDARDGA